MLGTLSAVVGIASQVAGLFGKKNRQPTLNLRKLRNDAINNGFHPLTVLQATGGQGFHTGGGPNKLATFAESAAGVADVLQNYASFKTAQEESDARIRLIDAETKAAEQRVSDNRAVPAYAPLTTQGAAINQNAPQWETWDQIPYVKLFNIDGSTIEVKKIVTDRLGLKAGDIWIAEDSEAVWGDLMSELAAFGVVADRAWQTIKGVDPIFKGKSTNAKYSKEKRPMKPLETPEAKIAPVKNPRDAFKQKVKKKNEEE